MIHLAWVANSIVIFSASDTEIDRDRRPEINRRSDRQTYRLTDRHRQGKNEQTDKRDNWSDLSQIS